MDQCEDDSYNNQGFSGYPTLSRSDHIDVESSDVTNDADYQACMELYAQINQQRENMTKSFSGPVYQQRKGKFYVYFICNIHIQWKNVFNGLYRESKAGKVMNFKT